MISARVRDIPSRPIYGVGERSGIRVRTVAPRIAWLLFKGFWWRMKEKYVIRDFHPLVFFYVLGTLMTLVGLLVGIEVTIRRFGGHQITTPTIVLVALLAHLGHAVHPVCDVVRPGVKQGPALSGFLEPLRCSQTCSCKRLANARPAKVWSAAAGRWSRRGS